MGGSFWSERRGRGFKTIVHIAKQGVKAKTKKNIREKGFKHWELNAIFKKVLWSIFAHGNSNDTYEDSFFHFFVNDYFLE